MRKTLICAVALAAATAPAASAAKPDKDKPAKPDKVKPVKPDKAKPYCTPKSVGYNARGEYVSGSLALTAGGDTSKRGDDRFSGELVVDVKKVNQKGLKGEQAFTLTDVRAKFHPGEVETVTAGDRVKLSGKVTKLAGKKCDTSGFTPTVTVRKADFKTKKAAKA